MLSPGTPDQPLTGRQPHAPTLLRQLAAGHVALDHQDLEFLTVHVGQGSAAASSASPHGYVFSTLPPV